MTQDAWISFREATELTKTRLNASAGHAEALVRRAVASGEVRTQAPPILLAADDGVVGMDLRAMDQAGTERLSELDLVDWLDRNSPTTTSKPRPQLDRERAKAAAFAIWGELGPPKHLANILICRDIAERLKKDGQNPDDISTATMLRAVGRKE